jgi:ribosomal protein S18 acetylase RimI-like enzyme
MRALKNEPIVGWGRRPPEPSDDGFLYRLYGSTREEELAVWGAPEEQRELFLRLQFTAQRAHYARHFPLADHHIITIDDEPVGRTLVDRTRDEIRLVDVAILTEHRNAGLGSILLHELLDESAAAGRPVRLHVFKPSRAVGFYERLGFRRIGDEQTHWALEWAPKPEAERP